MIIFDFILHLDKYLADLISFFGAGTYAILFLIIFAETGFVVTPFLPGDSLLFAVGAFAGGGFLHLGIAYLTLLLAAILGDTVNYWLGHYFGPKIFFQEKSRLLNRAHLEKTREFYERHGGKTIILARFVPIVRTFAPFVAGVGKMHYRTFLFYNVLGGVAWVTILTLAGYLFGGLPWVKENFEKVIFGIIVISLLPMVAEYWRSRCRAAVKPAVSSTTLQDIKNIFHHDPPSGK